MSQANKIYLTFDVEEFDLPEEYNIPIDKQEQLNISSSGLSAILKLLETHAVKATFFTTAFYAENNPQKIKEIADKGHEIGSHLYCHSVYDEGDILKSKQKIEEIIGKPIYGFRSPRLQKLNYNAIKQAGYMYDSSFNPTFIPGRYNNYFKTRNVHTINNLYIIPFSVSPFIRFPLFWLSFKNINLNLYTFLCKQTLKKDKYLHLYFHPWEFADISRFNIPKYLKRDCGNVLLKKLDLLIQNLKKSGDFELLHTILKP